MLDAYNGQVASTRGLAARTLTISLEIIGDALTALTSVRNTFSTIFVFAMPAWISAVGMANVFNTIGAIGAIVLCFAAFFIWKGKHLRVRTARIYRYYASRQFEARPL